MYIVQPCKSTLYIYKVITYRVHAKIDDNEGEVLNHIEEVFEGAKGPKGGRQLIA